MSHISVVSNPFIAVKMYNHFVAYLVSFWLPSCIFSVVIHVVLTLTHRYNAVCGHRTGSNNSGVENYLRRNTNKNKRQYTQ